jgi:hypothetical protein
MSTTYLPPRPLEEIIFHLSRERSEIERGEYGFVYARRMYELIDPAGSSDYSWHMLNDIKSWMLRLGLIVAIEFSRGNATRLLTALIPSLSSYEDVANAILNYYSNDPPMTAYVTMSLIKYASPRECRPFYRQVC